MPPPYHVRKTLRLSEDELERLPIFPLPAVVLLPQALLPLHIFEPRYRTMTRDALASDKPIAMTLPIDDEKDEHGRPAVHAVAGVGKILQYEALPDGRYNILLFGLGRIHIERELEVDTPYRQVQATLQLGRVETRDELETLLHSVRTLTLAIRGIEPKVADELNRMMDPGAGEEAIVDRLAGMFFPDFRRRQRLLEELIVERRLAVVVDRMAQYLAQLRMERGGGDGVLN